MQQDERMKSSTWAALIRNLVDFFCFLSLLYPALQFSMGTTTRLPTVHAHCPPLTHSLFLSLAVFAGAGQGKAKRSEAWLGLTLAFHLSLTSSGVCFLFTWQLVLSTRYFRPRPLVDNWKQNRNCSNNNGTQQRQQLLPPSWPTRRIVSWLLILIYEKSCWNFHRSR